VQLDNSQSKAVEQQKATLFQSSRSALMSSQSSSSIKAQEPKPVEHSRLKQKIFTVISQNQQDYFEQNDAYFSRQLHQGSDTGFQINQRFKEFET
jgi:hypothetical protein